MWPRSPFFIPVNGLILSSAEPLGEVEVRVKDGGMGLTNEEEKCISSDCVWGWTRHRLRQRKRAPRPVALRSASDCSQEKADHKYARLRPAGSRPTALLPRHVAAVGGGVIFFFHSTSFPRRTKRKRAADAWETAREGSRAENPDGPGSS